MSSTASQASTNEMFLASTRDATPQPLHSFLSLAPVQSASYPLQHKAEVVAPVTNNTPISEPAETSVLSPAIPLAGKLAVLPSEEVDKTLKTRRSSSVSSDGSVRRRFLKLGPVFWGGQPGVGDYAEEDI